MLTYTQRRIYAFDIGEDKMSARKQFQSELTINPELAELLEKARVTTVSEDELHEQRVSFAYGNAPQDADLITKDSVRRSSKNIRLKD